MEMDKRLRYYTIRKPNRREQNKKRRGKLSEKGMVNEPIVEKLYDAQSRADFEEYFSLASEGIVYYAAGDCLVSGVERRIPGGRLPRGEQQ